MGGQGRGPGGLNMGTCEAEEGRSYRKDDVLVSVRDARVGRRREKWGGGSRGVEE